MMPPTAINLRGLLLLASWNGSLIWPPWPGRERWRWLALGFSLVLISYGLFRKQMTWRNYGSLHGLLFGEVTQKPWQVIFKRAFFVLLGLCVLTMAFSSEPFR